MNFIASNNKINIISAKHHLTFLFLRVCESHEPAVCENIWASSSLLLLLLLLLSLLQEKCC